MDRTARWIENTALSQEVPRVLLDLTHFSRQAATREILEGKWRWRSCVLYLPQLSRIYHALLQSSYAPSPQVARLGLLLFQVGACSH